MIYAELFTSREISLLLRKKGGALVQVKLIRRKNGLIIRLNGELDHHTATVFREVIDKELAKDIVQNLVLNFDNLTFMDSSGIGAILGRYRQVKAKGGKMVFCGVSKHIKKILQMGGLLTIIPVLSDETKALASLQ
jgi:stage II sporulation protein AA (anti-sigma F factor antagonist)